MAHLAEHRFVHRDLACRNVLLDSQLTCKVADFGLSRATATGSSNESAPYYRSTQGTFPIRWTAPEAIETLVFTTRSDVWSFAITSIEIFTDGETPYSDLRNRDVVDAVSAGRRIDRPKLCDAHFYNLIQRCWAADALERPIFADISNELAEMVATARATPDFVARHHRAVHTRDYTSMESDIGTSSTAEFKPLPHGQRPQR